MSRIEGKFSSAFSSYDMGYVRNYCEENIFRIAHRGTHVIVISNAKQCVPFFGKGDEVVVWDYHVILLDRANRFIYDFDSPDAMPCDAKRYVDCVLRSTEVFPRCYERMYRVIEAPIFRDEFASDRSHMRRGDGTYLAEPPPWPCINPHLSSNLQSLVKISEPETSTGISGCVMAEETFLAFVFGG